MREAAETPGSAYEWTRPDGKLRVWVAPEAVARLRSEAMHGLEAFPKRGLEVGGLLLGRTENLEAGARVVVQSAQPVPCEHQFGSGYVLSERDLEAFRIALARQRSEADPQSTPVGYYRTQMQPGGSLRLEEAEWLQVCFPELEAIFLVITPSAFGECTAQVFYREGPRIVGVPCEEPFGPTIATITPQRESLLADASPAASPENHARKQQLRWTAIGAVALLSLAAITATIVVRKRVAPQQARPAAPTAALPRAADLGLEAAQMPDHLLITWNKNAPDVMRASRAALLIRDGSSESTVDITPAQLQSGSVFYVPAGPDVQFRLELSLRDGGTVAESVRVLGRGALPAQEPADIAGRAIIVTESDVRLARQHNSSAERAGEADHAAIRTLDRFLSPSRVVEKPPVPLLEPPPNIAPARSPLATDLGFVSPAAPQRPAPTTEPLDYVAPRVVSRVYPQVPPAIRSMLSGERTVDVAVVIGPDGRVLRATAPRDPRPLQSFLIDAAVDAARRFRFDPARKNNQP